MTKSRNRFTENGDGSLSIKTDFPPELRPLVTFLGKQFGGDDYLGMRVLFRKLAALVRNADFIALLGEETKPFLETPADNLRKSAIDYSRLHRSDKVKSGYVGVYSNGKGFRANALDPGTLTQISLGTFPHADEAAWARYQHYTRHDLPYGKFEEAWNYMRTIGNVAELSREMQMYLAADNMYICKVPPDHIPEKYMKYYGPNSKPPEEEEAPASAEELRIIAKLHATVAKPEEPKAEEINPERVGSMGEDLDKPTKILIGKKCVFCPKPLLKDAERNQGICTACAAERVAKYHAMAPGLKAAQEAAIETDPDEQV